jgi:hypothetical protein
MPTISDVISIFEYLGIGPEAAFGYILLGLVIFLAIRFSLGSALKGIDQRCFKIEGYLSSFTSAVVTGGDPALLGIFTTNSPVFLNDIGKRMIEQSPFAALVSDDSNQLFKLLDSRDLKTKFDVEASALSVILESFDEEWMKEMKIYIYNNPVVKIDNLEIPKAKFIQACSIYLRDKYLEKHPKIKE